MYVHVCVGWHLVVVERLECSNESQSYVVWSLELLVGLALVRFQTKSSPLIGGLDCKWMSAKVIIHLHVLIPIIHFQCVLSCEG